MILILMILDTLEEIVEERSGLRWGWGVRVEATSGSVSIKKNSSVQHCVPFLQYCSSSNILIDLKLIKNM